MEPPPKTKETKPIQQRRLFFFLERGPSTISHRLEIRSSITVYYHPDPSSGRSSCRGNDCKDRSSKGKSKGKSKGSSELVCRRSAARIGRPTRGTAEPRRERRPVGDSFVFFCPALMKLNKSIDDNGRHEGSHLGLEVKLEVK